MAKPSSRTVDSRASRVIIGVVVPVVLLLIVVGVIAGLVAGGVLQGDADRAGAGASPTTVPTILIEP